MNWKPLGGNSNMEYMNILGGTLYRVIGSERMTLVPVSEEILHRGLKSFLTPPA